MHYFLRKFFLFFLLIFISIKAFAFENLAYTWRGFPSRVAEGKIALDDLKTHASQIDIYSSQAYYIHEDGKVGGALNAAMLKVALDSKIKVMPLVTNADFNRENTHHFLNDTAAEDSAMQTLLKLCQLNHFYGLQIDFEGMSHLDRDAFTKFYQKLADLLHKNGFRISAAIIPDVSDNNSAFLRARYRGWSGVYDYDAIGKSSDFVTLMTYDQHEDMTTPGPLSGLRWNENIIQYALKKIPAEKLSLGVPLHSEHWYTGRAGGSHIRVHGVDLNYSEIMPKLNALHATLQWEDKDKVHYSLFQHNFLYEYVFLEDSASYAAKLDLVKKYKLRGISNWCLGEEDPAIWKLLPAAKRS